MNRPCAGLALILSGMVATITASGVRLAGGSWWSTVGAGLLVLVAFTAIVYVALDRTFNGDPGTHRRAEPDQGKLLERLGAVETGEHARGRR